MTQDSNADDRTEPARDDAHEADVIDIRTPGLAEALGSVDHLSIWELLRRFGRAATVEELEVASGLPRARVQAALDALAEPGDLLVERVPAGRGRREPLWRNARDAIVIGYRVDDPADDAIRERFGKLFGEDRRREILAHAKSFGDRGPGEFVYNGLHAGAFTSAELKRIWELLQELERLFHASNRRFHRIEPTEPQWCTYHVSVDIEPLRPGILPMPTMQVIGRKWAAETARSFDARLATLSKRERDVAFRLRDGMTQREIADAIGVSYHTVVTLTRRLYAKLGVKRRKELVDLLIGQSPR